MDLKKALQIALDFEKKGHDLYKIAAEKSSLPFVKTTFTYLAAQELQHIKDINVYLAEQPGDMKLSGDRPVDVKQFFNTTIGQFKDKVTLNQSDTEAYETALALEKDAFNFYKEQLRATDDEKAKKFFKFLMEQENSHFVLLENSFGFIKDPDHFFAEDEKWFFEG
ncbi:hypothetical protein COV93_03360 [Candidatus Woesearchaeota archaeon CG11_big_fil_rev_8_21_14_0_20_43_8]|nr:MAG: hypothetical protein COV93_03360 [Candidatus Woesearchaeota archaeon CG11_big_fil_rev_8_21_14_0_20_43_8]PIO05487.1 MAG: hypothetical protein COT47_04600 [Candidatus Woesearchaeota archaeon CG08_land_8_20_14_0_20_43_7]